MAIAIKPDDAEAHHNLSFALLNSGRLKQGLDESEWRWKVNSEVSGERRFLQPVWDGKVSLADKRILVWCEQGIGDIIRCSHLLPSISSQAQHCILECPEKLIPLFSNSFPNVEVRPENRRRDLKRDDFDVHLPTGSLHKLFLTEVIQNTRPSAFLVPDPIRINFWKSRLSSLGSGPYVGISWKSSLMQRERLKFYPPISDWAPLLELENITFINLQYADSKNDLIQMKNAFGVKVHNFDDLDQYNNLADVAALCAALDCVVSISNAVPTISAGVGTPTKYAVPAIYDWNNIIGHPVGPAVDIFKRNRHLPWSNVFGLIADDIAKLYEFPNNKRARNGIKSLAVGSAKRASKVQDPPQDQLQALIELYSQGLLQHALKQAENLIQQFSRSAILFNVQGNIFKDLKQFDLSRLAYERAIALMPDFADAYNNMGNALKEQGKLEEAVEAYNKALAIKPDYANGYYNLGVVLKEQGKWEEAIETYKKALVIKPDFADAYTNMGNALRDQG